MSETSIPATLVHREDVLRVTPGSRMPADGVVVQGSSQVGVRVLLVVVEE